MIYMENQQYDASKEHNDAVESEIEQQVEIYMVGPAVESIYSAIEGNFWELGSDLKHLSNAEKSQFAKLATQATEIFTEFVKKNLSGPQNLDLDLGLEVIDSFLTSVIDENVELTNAQDDAFIALSQNNVINELLQLFFRNESIENLQMAE